MYTSLGGIFSTTAFSLRFLRWLMRMEEPSPSRWGSSSINDDSALRLDATACRLGEPSKEKLERASALGGRGGVGMTGMRRRFAGAVVGGELTRVSTARRLERLTVRSG